MKQYTAYYLRTSHYLQSIETQRDKVPVGDNIMVFEDAGISGTVPFSERPQARKLLAAIVAGKILEVQVLRLDRLGRSAQDMLNTIKSIHSYGVPIRSINEGLVSMVDGKETAMSNLVINTLISLAEFQYLQGKEKQSAGIAIARIKDPSKFPGRRHASTETQSRFLGKVQSKKVIELLSKGFGTRAICRTINCNANTIYKVKRILEEQSGKAA